MGFGVQLDECFLINSSIREIENVIYATRDLGVERVEYLDEKHWQTEAIMRSLLQPYKEQIHGE